MEIIQKSWSKRRAHTADPIVKNVELSGYKEEHNHICKMHVEYEDGNHVTYIARVIYHNLKNEWIVDGMHVAVRM